MKVSDFMTKDCISFGIKGNIQDAAKLMVEKKISALPIVDADGKLKGIITESDFVGGPANIPHALVSIKSLLGQYFYFGDVEDTFKKAQNLTVESIMSKNPKTVTPDHTLTDVVNLMIERDLKRLPVVQGEKLLGMITRRNIMKAFAEMKKS